MKRVDRLASIAVLIQVEWEGGFVKEREVVAQLVSLRLGQIYYHHRVLARHQLKDRRFSDYLHLFTTFTVCTLCDKHNIILCKGWEN